MRTVIGVVICVMLAVLPVFAGDMAESAGEQIEVECECLVQGVESRVPEDRVRMDGDGDDVAETLCIRPSVELCRISGTRSVTERIKVFCIYRL